MMLSVCQWLFLPRPICCRFAAALSRNTVCNWVKKVEPQLLFCLYSFCAEFMLFIHPFLCHLSITVFLKWFCLRPPWQEDSCQEFTWMLLDAVTYFCRGEWMQAPADSVLSSSIPHRTCYRTTQSHPAIVRSLQHLYLLCKNGHCR